MIYIIGGPGKTGSSAIAVRLSREFNIPRLYGGGYLRTEAIKAGCIKDNYIIPDDVSLWDLDKADIKSFRALCAQQHRDIDLDLDLFTLEAMVRSISDNSDIVIDAKAMSRLIHSDIFPKYLKKINERLFKNENEYISKEVLLKSYKSVWLHCDIRTRALRVLFKKRKELKETDILSFTEDEINKEIEDLSSRQSIDKKDYILKYDMDDYPDASSLPLNQLFGTIVDNTDQSEDQTYKTVKNTFGL